MGIIYNKARFEQQTDFTEIVTWSSDIDLYSNINNKAHVWTEFKTIGSGVPYGQKLAFKRLVSDMGQVKPAFLAIAEHDTRPSEYIDGSNSICRSILYRLPNMFSVQEYIYETHFPTVNQFISDLTLHLTQPKALKAAPTFWEGFNLLDVTEEYDCIDDIPKDIPEEFFHHIRNELEAHKQ